MKFIYIPRVYCPRHSRRHDDRNGQQAEIVREVTKRNSSTGDFGQHGRPW